MKTIALVAAMFVWLACGLDQIQAQGSQELPASCYSEINGTRYVDLRTCSLHFSQIPYPELWQGFIGLQGHVLPFPPVRSDTFAPGFYLSGNATRYAASLMQDRVQLVSSEFGLDPTHYVGGIAIDSCGYEAYTAQVEVMEFGVSVGPLLVADCRNLLHKQEHACPGYGLQTVAEIVYEDFGIPYEAGLLEGVTVTLAPPGSLTVPEMPADLQPVFYPQAWLESAGILC